MVNAFPLTGGGSARIPFLVDLHHREVMTTDLAVHGHPGSRADRDGPALASLVRAAAARPALKASVAELVQLHALAHGAVVVAEPDLADVTVGLSDGCAYNAERLLADLV